MDMLPWAFKPSFLVHLEGLLAGNLIKDLAGFIKFSFHQLPSAVSRVYPRFKFGILLKSLTPLLVLVNVAKPLSGRFVICALDVLLCQESLGNK